MTNKEFKNFIKKAKKLINTKPAKYKGDYWKAREQLDQKITNILKRLDDQQQDLKYLCSDIEDSCL